MHTGAQGRLVLERIRAMTITFWPSHIGCSRGGGTAGLLILVARTKTTVMDEESLGSAQITEEG